MWMNKSYNQTFLCSLCSNRNCSSFCSSNSEAHSLLGGLCMSYPAWNAFPQTLEWAAPLHHSVTNFNITFSEKCFWSPVLKYLLQLLLNTSLYFIFWYHLWLAEIVLLICWDDLFPPTRAECVSYLQLFPLYLDTDNNARYSINILLNGWRALLT